MTISNFNLLDTEILLFAIDSNDIELFKSLASKHIELLSSIVPNSKGNLNIFINVCDIWSALKSYDHSIFLDQNKCLSYPPSALLLNLIADNSTVQNFTHTDKLSLEQQFIFSYFISAETMTWIRNLFTDANLSYLIEHYIHDVNYFDTQLNGIAFTGELSNQTHIVKAMMKNIRETNEFHFAIINAISSTKKYFQQTSP